MPACASIPAAPAARRASSTSGRRARRKTSTTASNGRARSPGARQGRHQRHLLFRHQPVAGRRAAAAASRRALHLGRLRRLLPRARAPRRHPLRLHRELVPAPGAARAARRRRPRPAQRGHRRAGGGAGDAAGGRAAPGTRADRRAARSRGAASIDDYYRARMAAFEQIEVPLLSAGNWGGMGLHPRGNFEGYLRAGSQAEVARGARRHPLHALLQRLRRSALQKRFFGHFLKGEDTGWDKQPRVSLNIRRPGEKFALRAENEWPLARTQWTKYYLRPSGTRSAPTCRRSDDAHLRDDGRRPHLPHAADDRGDGDHRPGRGEALAVVRHHRRRRVPGAARVRSRTARKSPSSARTIRARRSGSAGCAPRIASSIRTQTLPYRPWHTHDEAWPLDAGQAGRARRRDLADLHRRAAGLSARPHRARQGL